MTPERLAELETKAKHPEWRFAAPKATILDLIAHIRDLEAPPKCARGCDRDGVGSPCIHELSPDELTGVADHIRDLEAQVWEARKFLKDTHTSLTTALIQVERYQWLLDERATATATPPSLSAKERQRRSFAYGNVHIDNPNVTREMVDRAAEQLASEPPSPEVGA